VVGVPWAAFSLTADILLSLSKVTYISNTVRSRSADLYLRVIDGSLQTDGVYLDGTWYDSADYGSPIHRVVVEDAGTRRSSLAHRIVVDGGAFGNGVGATTSQGIFGVVGNTTDGSTALVLSKCEARGFTTGASINGFVLRPIGVGTVTGGIELDGCQALRVTGTGIIWVGIAGDSIVNANIHDCVIDHCTGWGVDIHVPTDGASVFTGLHLRNNRVTTNTAGGIRVGPGSWVDPLDISHNFCYLNGAGGTVDIFIGWATGAHPNTARGVLMGNDCGGSGEIWFHDAWSPMTGAATKYTVGATIADADALGDDGIQMMFNNATLQIDP
jgi:hypothetical protein